jgi:peptidyl-prolyl cis-trans isomerase SurA
MLGAQAFAQGEGLLLDEIVAKVDNRILMRSEFDIRLFQYKTTAIEIGEKDKTCAVFESMLVEKLLLAKADIDSVYVEEEQVTATLDQRMQYFIAQFGSAKKLEAAYGKTIDELKNELKDQVKDQLVARKMQDNITSKIKITPAEVRRFFAKIPVDSLPFFPAEVEVAQIVKYAAISRAQKAEAKKKLELLKERVLSGEKFEELALLYSDDLGSRKAGGELDFRKRGELVPEFEAAALKLKPGEMSEIVESPFGFHLIQLIARKGNEFNSRHILIKPGSSSVDVSEAVQYLDSLRALILLDTISFEKAARSYSDDKVTAANGGFFYDRENNTKRLPLEALDPGVFFTIDTMDVGQISTPVTYRTPDDKEAARIIYYKLKIPPHQANLVDDYEKIYNAALENKKAEAIEKWFDKVKKDVFISSHEDFKNCDVLKQ